MSDHPHIHGVDPALQPKDERVYVPSFDTLDVFDAPGGHVSVEYTSDEVTALCPVTSQPDYYLVEISLVEAEHLIESKSLKLYLGSYRQYGAFAEKLASMIANDVMVATKCGDVTVTVRQKARGGIAITARSQADYEEAKQLLSEKAGSNGGS